MGVEELKAALRPFAEYAKQMEKQWGQRDSCVFYGVKRPGAKQITYGDFRRAVRALEAQEKQDD
jgi:hypothetical protein